MSNTLQLPWDKQSRFERFGLDVAVGCMINHLSQQVMIVLLIAFGFEGQLIQAFHVSSQIRNMITTTSPLITFLNILVAPALETTFLIIGWAFLSLFLKRNWMIVLISGLLWGVLHSWDNSPFYGFMVFVPFMVYTYQFIRWKDESIALAFMTPFLSHAINNGMAFLS